MDDEHEVMEMGIERVLKIAATEAFPNKPDSFFVLKLCQAVTGEADFVCGLKKSALKLKEDLRSVAEKIKDKIPTDNELIQKVEVSDNGSSLNIFILPQQARSENPLKQHLVHSEEISKVKVNTSSIGKNWHHQHRFFLLKSNPELKNALIST